MDPFLSLSELVVRFDVHLKSAKNLAGKDWHAFGKATSDPYVKLRLGGQAVGIRRAWPKGPKTREIILISNSCNGFFI